jgi:transposase
MHCKRDRSWCHFALDKCRYLRHILRMHVDSAECSLVSRTVGALPIINEVLTRLNVETAIREFVPGDIRSQCSPSVVLGVLLRNVLLARRALYAVPKWAGEFPARLLGIPPDVECQLNDDRIGRALDRLFVADRAALMTAIVVAAAREFHVNLNELHNDSTTITFEGEYKNAKGHLRSGVQTQRITHGHNKDHRPDLKQLVYNLTTTADGATPVWCNVTHGNASDDTTHIGTWETLRELTGGVDFLYVADSKLCTRDNMEHIASHGGHFVTILPRSRAEVSWFAEWLKTHKPEWDELVRQPSSRHEGGPDEVYRGFQSPLPTSEGYRLFWVWSSQKAERDQLQRQRSLARASEQMEALAARLQSTRSRVTSAAAAYEAAKKILDGTGTSHLINVAVETRVAESFKQTRPGRPSSGTPYLRETRERFEVHWTVLEELVIDEARMDGVFPLVTNAAGLSAKKVLAAYKHQPALERRHEALKSTLLVRPVFLKSPSRIEAFLFICFLAQLVLALIERQLRRAMAEEEIAALLLYPEERPCERPTARLLFRLFESLRSHVLLAESGIVARTFHDPLNPHQVEVLHLLNLRPSTFYAGS